MVGAMYPNQRKGWVPGVGFLRHFVGPPWPRGGLHRVSAKCHEFGLKAGFAMDLWNGWDFILMRHRAAARKYIEVVRPKLLICSPECTMFSILESLSKWYEKRQEMLQEATERISSVMGQCLLQHQESRHFLCERSEKRHVGI